MAQETSQRDGGGDGEESAAGPETAGQQRRDTLDADTEATLDEIDDVLEDNAEQFVQSYVQKGGE